MSIQPVCNLPVDDAHAKTVCKIGQGAACCRYLAMGGNGWSCEKGSNLRYHLDARVAQGTMNARGDNCDGRLSK